MSLGTAIFLSSCVLAVVVLYNSGRPTAAGSR
jgi:hypothetical protein